MTIRTVQADRRTVVDAYSTPPRTVVAVPPSTASADPRLMLVSISGSPILRPYDDNLDEVVIESTYGSYEGGY